MNLMNRIKCSRIWCSKESRKADEKEIKEVMIIWHNIYMKLLCKTLLSILVQTTLGNQSFSKSQNLIMSFP